MCQKTKGTKKTQRTASANAASTVLTSRAILLQGRGCYGHDRSVAHPPSAAPGASKDAPGQAYGGALKWPSNSILTKSFQNSRLESSTLTSSAPKRWRGVNQAPDMSVADGVLIGVPCLNGFLYTTGHIYIYKRICQCLCRYLCSLTADSRNIRSTEHVPYLLLSLVSYRVTLSFSQHVVQTCLVGPGPRARGHGH